MPNARVVNAEPESLKKICSFTANNDDENQELRNIAYRATQNDLVKLRKLLDKDLPTHIHNDYEIVSNDVSFNRVAFKKNEDIVSHIDGVLQDYETGELLYFVAIEDGENVNIDDIEEGSEVDYNREYYDGVCEVILHKREKHSKIIGDINLGRNSVVVRYVKITKSYPDNLPELSMSESKTVLTPVKVKVFNKE